MVTTRSGTTTERPTGPTRSSSAGLGKRQRGNQRDDEDDEPRRSKRTALPTYELAKRSKVNLVVAHWRQLAPITNDNPRAVDQRAMDIIPGNSLNCAAVVVDPPNLPIVAMNTWSDAAVEGAGNHPQVFAQGAYTHVADTTVGLHAEMRILQHLGGVLNQNIGISKRCCLRCAVVMRILNHSTRIRGNSGEIYETGWIIPPFIKNNRARMREFLGQEVFDWLEPYTATQKADFYGLLQTASPVPGG